MQRSDHFLSVLFVESAQDMASDIQSLVPSAGMSDMDERQTNRADFQRGATVVRDALIPDRLLCRLADCFGAPQEGRQIVHSAQNSYIITDVQVFRCLHAGKS